jgi:hypothetical protein
MISVSPHVAPENSVFAAFVGLDWADQKHDLVLYDQRGGRADHRELLQTPEALDEWACGLRQRFGGRPIAVCPVNVLRAPRPYFPSISIVRRWQLGD